MLPSRIRFKVALITELYTPSVGGQQTRFEALAKGLTALGDDVTVICTRNVQKASRDEVLDGVRILRAPFLPRYEQPWVKPLQRSPVGILRFALEARRELRHGSFDAVYFNQWPYLPIVFSPRAVRQRGGIDWCEFRTGAVHKVLARTLPPRVGFNASVNTWAAEQIWRLSGSSIAYLPTGVWVREYWQAPASERDGILSLGRLVPNKNLPLLIDAFRALCERGMQDHLRIAGDGPEFGRLASMIAGLEPDVRARVELLGRVDDERKRALLASSRVLAISSSREGFPNVVAEAAASGLPIATVSSPLNGTAVVVERYGIGTVGEPTPSGLADAIERAVASSDELREKCTAAALELDWNTLSIQLHDMLEHAQTNRTHERG